jgi:hypothetical protein
MEMKNGLLLTGVLLALAMLFVGCTGPSNTDSQVTGTPEVQQQSPPGDNQQPDDWAQGQPGQQAGRQPGPRGGMNAAFAEPCNGKVEGQACTLTFRNQTSEGKCTSRNGNITCTPNNGSMGQRAGGFPEGGAAFVQACQGKAVGDACALTMRNQTVDGKCAERNGNISCMANNMNPGQRPQNGTEA